MIEGSKLQQNIAMISQTRTHYRNLEKIGGGGLGVARRRGRAIAGYAYTLAGNQQEARKILAELNHLLETDLFAVRYTGTLCEAIGEFDQAFQLLNRLCDERFGAIVWIDRPMIDPLAPTRDLTNCCGASAFHPKPFPPGGRED